MFEPNFSLAAPHPLCMTVARLANARRAGYGVCVARVIGGALDVGAKRSCKTVSDPTCVHPSTRRGGTALRRLVIGLPENSKAGEVGRQPFQAKRRERYLIRSCLRPY